PVPDALPFSLPLPSAVRPPFFSPPSSSRGGLPRLLANCLIRSKLRATAMPPPTRTRPTTASVIQVATPLPSGLRRGERGRRSSRRWSVKSSESGLATGAATGAAIGGATGAVVMGLGSGGAACLWGGGGGVGFDGDTGAGGAGTAGFDAGALATITVPHFLQR